VRSSKIKTLEDAYRALIDELYVMHPETAYIKRQGRAKICDCPDLSEIRELVDVIGKACKYPVIIVDDSR